VNLSAVLELIGASESEDVPQAEVICGECAAKTGPVLRLADPRWESDSVAAISMMSQFLDLPNVAGVSQ